VQSRQLSSISHHFTDIAPRSQKPFHLSLSPRSLTPSNFVLKLPIGTFESLAVKTAWFLQLFCHNALEIEHRKVEKPPTSVWAPDREDHLEFRYQTYYARSKTLLKFYVKITWSYTSVVLLQHIRVTDDIQTDDRQTTYHENSRILQWSCNVLLNRVNFVETQCIFRACIKYMG